jgi:hypothetical protein
MSDEPTWNAQETKTFGDFEKPLGMKPVPMPQLDNEGIDQSKLGHTEHLPSLLEKLRPRFALAFGQQAREEIDWEISMMFYPNPQNGAAQAVLVIFAQMPGAVLGTTISASVMVQPTMEMGEHVEDQVRQLLETLRSGRSQQLSAMQEQPRDHGLRPPTNGGGGLVLPGN